MYFFENSFENVRFRFFQWEKSLPFFYRLILSLLFASITGLFTQIRFYLPFTPVPITGQVFAVLLSTIILGKYFGSLSQIFYVALGISGIHWFAIGPIGPTGGYLAGFIAAPLVIGIILEKSKKRNMQTILLSMISGIFTIYAFGFTQFLIFTKVEISKALYMSVLPFIPFDLIKAFACTLIAGFILPKKSAVKK